MSKTTFTSRPLFYEELSVKIGAFVFKFYRKKEIILIVCWICESEELLLKWYFSRVNFDNLSYVLTGYHGALQAF